MLKTYVQSFEKTNKQSYKCTFLTFTFMINAFWGIYEFNQIITKSRQAELHTCTYALYVFPGILRNALQIIY